MKRKDNIHYYMAIGFTAEEAERMLIGETINGAIQRQGGFYQVGNVTFPQAISGDHAIKLYELITEYKGELVRKLTIKNGVKWVVTE